MKMCFILHKSDIQFRFRQREGEIQPNNTIKNRDPTTGFQSLLFILCAGAKRYIYIRLWVSRVMAQQPPAQIIHTIFFSLSALL